MVGGLAAIVLGSSKPHAKLPGNVGETAGGSFAGGTLIPAKAAPPTTLRNYLGQTVSLSEYRGKVVFVTFLYTRCPDVCPLIATNLHATQAALGAANAKVQMLAISVDPTGDTPKAVANFLRVHKLVGRIQYLVGSAAELGRVWAAWNVGSARDAASPALVDHSALVYGISANGCPHDDLPGPVQAVRPRPRHSAPARSLTPLRQRPAAWLGTLCERRLATHAGAPSHARPDVSPRTPAAFSRATAESRRRAGACHARPRGLVRRAGGFVARARRIPFRRSG